MELHITCIPGDGIGPEIVAEAKKVLEKTAEVFGHKIVFEDILMGGASIDVHGVPLTEDAVKKARAADAVLMGSIGGDTTTSPWYQLPPKLRPEAGLLAIRKELNLFANLRPAVLYEELAAACPLREEISKYAFFAHPVVHAWYGGGSVCADFLSVFCKLCGMSGVRAAHVNDDVHPPGCFFDDGLRNGLSFIAVQKESFAGAPAYVHLFYAFAAEIIDNRFGCFQVDASILLEWSVEGDGNLFEFVYIILRHNYTHLF